MFIAEHHRFDIDDLFRRNLPIEGAQQEAILLGLFCGKLADTEDNIFLVLAVLVKARRQGIILDQPALLGDAGLTVEMDPSFVPIGVDAGVSQNVVTIYGKLRQRYFNVRK